VSDDVETLSEDQLDHLARYFNEEVTFSKHIGAKVEEVEPGRSVVYIDVEDTHLNGTGTLHGGVYASLIDNAMGLSVLALVGVRIATVEMNVHFLGAPHPPDGNRRGESQRRGRQPRRDGHRSVPGFREEGQRDRLSLRTSVAIFIVVVAPDGSRSAWESHGRRPARVGPLIER
jgi:acyl-coenzyme A thioesterase PaaI-like protein